MNYAALINCGKQQPKFFLKKLFLKLSQYSQENTCVGGVVSCEYCEILKNIYFDEYTSFNSAGCNLMYVTLCFSENYAI